MDAKKIACANLEALAYSFFPPKINVFASVHTIIIIAAQVRGGGLHMRLPPRYLSLALLAAVLISPAIITGCSARVSTGYRVHDGYYNDDHLWNHDEIVYYNRWEDEGHRDHRDFRRRSDGERREYFKWRHDHDHDRYRDGDHDRH